MTRSTSIKLVSLAGEITIPLEVTSLIVEMPIDGKPCRNCDNVNPDAKFQVWGYSNMGGKDHPPIKTSLIYCENCKPEPK
jgi:hypothetical protein